MFKKISFIAVLLIVFAFNTSSTLVENQYIKSDEKLTFIASFNISGVMTDIAEVKMETSTVKTKSRELLRLKCTAATYSSWDKFFKVRDLYESYVDTKTLLPVLYKRSIEEGTYKKELKYLFKRKSKIAISTLNKKGYKDYKIEVPITNSTLDIVSSIYNARVLDYDNFSIGQKTTTKLIVDSEIETISITYRGKKNIQVANSGSRACYKLEISFVGNGLEKAKGGKFIYITADDDRLPALIEANIPIGRVQIRLSNYSK
ncbi:MAG: DUF3108 domain-containing protein [Flavobacteriaceae bacterium]